MNQSHNTSRDPKHLHPEMERRMALLFSLYALRYPKSPQPKISQTVRSWSDQSKLYAQGRTAPGKIVTDAKPGESLHNYFPGLAFDVYFQEDGKALWDEKLFRTLGALASSVGLEWGGIWKHPDTPHFQPKNYKWEDAANNIEPTFPEVAEAILKEIQAAELAKAAPADEAEEESKAPDPVEEDAEEDEEAEG